MLTREEVDRAFAQPGENGYGKSRYDIANLLEKTVVANLLAAEVKPTLYKVGEDVVGAEDLVWFQHASGKALTPFYTEAQFRLEQQKVAQAVLLEAEARQKIEALSAQLQAAEKTIRTLQQTLDSHTADVYRLDFIQHAAEASSTGVRFEHTHVVEDGLSVVRGFRIRHADKKGNWKHSIRAVLDSEMGEMPSRLDTDKTSTNLGIDR